MTPSRDTADITSVEVEIALEEQVKAGEAELAAAEDETSSTPGTSAKRTNVR